jgi:hypothetical protein
LATSGDHELAIDSRGIYGESTLFLGKELRAGGLEADYLDEAGKRLFEAKKGLIVEGLLTVSLGVVSAAAWDGIKALLRRATPDKATLDVTYVDLSPEGRCRTWNVRGDRDGTLDAIDRLLDQSPGEEP